MKMEFESIETGEIGVFINEIHKLVESNKESLLIQFLACFGNCLGRTAYFNAAADIHFGNLYVVIVGRSSRGRKGQSLNIIKDLFSEVDPVWSREHVHKGLSSGEGLIFKLQDKIENDPSTGIEINRGALDKRLLCVESEFSSILKMTQRDGNTLSQILRDAWDSQDLQILTKKDPMKCTSPMFSLIGHITEAELVKYLNSTEIANGFANRCIFIKAQNDKKLPNPEPMNADLKKYLSTTIKIILEKAKKVKKVNFTDEAQKYWEKFYYSLSSDDASVVGTLTARQEPQIRRLAMIIALCNSKDQIDLDSLIFAEKIYEYCIQTVKEIYGDSLGNPVADKILELLKSSPNGSSRSVIHEALSKNYYKGSIDHSLKLLKSQGLADFKKVSTTGRPLEIWYYINKEDQSSGLNAELGGL